MWAKNTAHASVAHCLFAKFFLRVWTSVLSPVADYDDTKSILKANIFSKKKKQQQKMSTHKIDKVTNLPKLSWIYYTSAFSWIFRCRLTDLPPLYCLWLRLKHILNKINWLGKNQVSVRVGLTSNAHFAHSDLSHSCQASGKVQFMFGMMILRRECLLPC